MPINNQYRKSPRAKWIAYNNGTYFITVCTKNKQSYFGHISGDEMILSDVGRFLDKELSLPHIHHTNIVVVQYVVMPNHFHAIVVVGSSIGSQQLPESADDRRLIGYMNMAHRKRKVPCNIPLLSRYIGSLKSAVSRMAHNIGVDFEWQSRYHDHAIRDTRDLNKISEYISNNVRRWNMDCFNPESVDRQ